eukprot:5458715-Lingulodinium_polyedra.AAC.1
MKDLTCAGGELDVGACSWEAPDDKCLGHAFDSIVYCGNSGAAGSIQEGALRLLSADGSPSIDGEGRLEVFRTDVWAP